MKRKLLASLVVPSLAFATAAPEAQYLSSVHMAVHESSPALLQRSQRLVVDEFKQAVETWPELNGKRFEMRVNGNDVLFYMTSSDDMRAPLNQAVASLIQHLNGRVLARGRSLYYKTELSKPMGGYLEVTVDDTHTKILSVQAQSVPLRDLLKEIKAQVGAISYLVPGECAEQMVDWSFGESGPSEAKTIDAALSEIATLFNLKFEKRNGTYIFSGTCHERIKERHRTTPSEIFQSHFFQEPKGLQRPIGARVQQVFVPVFPFGE